MIYSSWRIPNILILLIWLLLVNKVNADKDGHIGYGEFAYRLEENIFGIMHEGEALLAKRLFRASLNISQEAMSSEEISLYTSITNNSDSSQKALPFSIKDPLVNVGLLKDFTSEL